MKNMNTEEIQSKISRIKNHELDENELSHLLFKLENPKTSKGKNSLQDYIMNADVHTLSDDVVRHLEAML